MYEDDSDEFTFSHLKKQQERLKKQRGRQWNHKKDCPEMESLIEGEVQPAGRDGAAWSMSHDGAGPSGYTSFSRGPGRQDSEQGMPPGYHDMGDNVMEIGHIAANQGPIEAHIHDPEREETIKCVVSTVLFFGIVIAIFVIAFVLNPQM